MSPKNEIKKLIQELKYHNNLYYNEAEPEISDFDYDILYKKLEKLEEKYPEFQLDTSPTKTIENG